MKKFLFGFVSVIFIICVFASCAKGEDKPLTETTAATTAAVAATEATTLPPPPEELTYLTSIGNGPNSFVFRIIDIDGNITEYLIKTESSTVGKALTGLGMISVNEASGVITDVNGIHADYNKDGIGWALYLNGEKQTASVNDTAIKNGAVYTFKLEK